jgi:hypothetical protein
VPGNELCDVQKDVVTVHASIAAGDFHAGVNFRFACVGYERAQ